MKNYEIDYSMIPEHMREGVKLYLERGLKPGSFLLAVLENDLAEAFARADETNRMALYNWVRFLCSEMPKKSWGSKEEVEAWMKKKREEDLR